MLCFDIRKPCILAACRTLQHSFLHTIVRNSQKKYILQIPLDRIQICVYNSGYNSRDSDYPIELHRVRGIRKYLPYEFIESKFMIVRR